MGRREFEEREKQTEGEIQEREIFCKKEKFKKKKRRKKRRKKKRTFKK